MPLAPTPDHDRVTDPAWLALYAIYEPLITPLRRRGLVTDIDGCGGSNLIHAALPDGTHLSIGPGAEAGGLPSHIDGTTEWLVIRESDDNPTVEHVVYDSTPIGPDAPHGAFLAPLLVAIDAFLASRGMLPEPVTHSAVVTVTTVHEYGPAAYAPTRPLDSVTEAAQRAAEIAESFPGDIIQHHASRDWPRYVLADGDRLVVVQVTLAELIPGDHSLGVRCYCPFAHPETKEDELRLREGIEYLHRIGDAKGLYIAMVRFYTARDCPARKASRHA
ncbi:hypothetical protein [Kitasatospora purpeofusca]|uniref:hypothetical protein n=1 Tax=Kitasatospora purpeofusca TaxID=67352 RepID=UPI002A59D89C|nr:hypothetical protein [Kitasatospora purpeofusca]MDY0811426.1 hypothetical protein [Kitasatospora purpeofusca]